jgi:hypothetical protein
MARVFGILHSVSVTHLEGPATLSEPQPLKPLPARKQGRAAHKDKMAGQDMRLPLYPKLEVVRPG